MWYLSIVLGAQMQGFRKINVMDIDFVGRMGGVHAELSKKEMKCLQ